MFTMMMIDMPLPMPRSVICSPSHMTSIVADVIAMTVRISKEKPRIGTSACDVRPSDCALSSQRAIAKDWPAHSTSVR